MKPIEARGTLRMLWWLQLAVALLPVLLLPGELYRLGEHKEWVSLVFFVVGLSLLFLNHRPFQRFKHAVIAVGQARQSPQEEQKAAWQQLMHVRLQALWFACLPAWFAVVAKILGLEASVMVLLTFATLVIFWLYRTPKQLMVNVES